MTATVERFLIAALIAGSGPLSGVSYSNQRVTTQAPSASACTVPPAVSSFLTTENTVYLYFNAAITTSDSLTNNWLAPDGTVIAGIAWNRASGSYCFNNSVNIGNLPASQLGSWQVRVYDNGALLFSVPFSVSAPAGFANQRVSTQAPPGSVCTVPPAVSSFLTTDNTVYLYFEATVTTSDTLSADWLAPDGMVITEGSWNPASGHHCFTGASLDIGGLPASQLGSWQARVYDNGALLFPVPFSVSAPAAISPAISAGGVVNCAWLRPSACGSGFHRFHLWRRSCQWNRAGDYAFAPYSDREHAGPD